MPDNNSNLRRVPIAIFLSVTGFMGTLIVGLIAWTWGAYVERQSIVAELNAQFTRQVELAAAAAEKIRVAETKRVDELQRDIAEIRARLDRINDARLAR